MVCPGRGHCWANTDLRKEKTWLLPWTLLSSTMSKIVEKRLNEELKNVHPTVKPLKAFGEEEGGFGEGFGEGEEGFGEEEEDKQAGDDAITFRNIVRVHKATTIAKAFASIRVCEGKAEGLPVSTRR